MIFKLYIICTNKFKIQEAFELENMLKTAQAIVYSAFKRKESRGAHFRTDFPEREDTK